MSYIRRFTLGVLPWMTTLVVSGCAAKGSGDGGRARDDLTSNTALQRTMTFSGVVYVASDATDDTLLSAIKAQTQSAMGAFRTAHVGVNTRELHDIDTSTFKRSQVTVVDAADPGAAPTTMTRVTYTYTDSALVPHGMASRTSIALGLLGVNYQSQADRVLAECTVGDSEAHEFRSTLWYVFEPSRPACVDAMTKEQRAIDADREAVHARDGVVTTSEVNRLYVPMTAALAPAETRTGGTYPEYARLYGGGVAPGKLVIGMVNGFFANWAANEHPATVDDDGYAMWLRGLRIAMAAKGWKQTAVDPPFDFSAVRAGGQPVAGVTLEMIQRWELDKKGLPPGLDDAGVRALRVAAAEALAGHWVTFQRPVRVSLGGAEPQDFTIELNSYFGDVQSDAPHKRAIKNSDVFLYNGHSYIGYGPLDPSRFSADDFPPSYQLFFINGCVSYNYYEKDYFALKPGGTRDLDLVTNGLETWIGGSGEAIGRFVATLVNGRQASYSALLKAAEFTDFGYEWGMDALRVVDGELDNEYQPADMPIVVTRR